MLVKILSTDLPAVNRDILLSVALGLARWAWQHHPLNRDVLRLLSTLTEAGADLGPSSSLARETARVLAGFPEEIPTKFDNPDTLSDFLSRIPDFRGKALLARRLSAEQIIVHAPADAEKIVEQVDSDLFSLWKATASLEVARKLCREVDFSRLKPVWNEFYWNTNLLLALYDLLYPFKSGVNLGQELSCPPVLLYSWNKCDALAQTLSSLRDSGIEGAPVFVLDNGSTDNSLEMLKGYKQNWPGMFTLVHLHVNVGAPAARNWLLSLPEVKREPWVVFLDDDVILPLGWLHGLCGAALANPDYGVVGCRITDHVYPFAVQAADFHLLAPEEAMHSFEDADESIFPFCSAMGETEEAMYAYTRPCVSVTGCCHLLNMSAIERAGAFDVRFNPSQFDDLERDVRSGLAGYPTYYHGQVQVRHMQHSSLRQAMRVSQQAHIMGNKIKLEFLLDAKKAAKLREENFTRVKTDLLRKCIRIEHALGGG